MSLVHFMDINLTGTEFEDEVKYWRFIGQDWIWLSLTDEDKAWCEMIAKKRHEANFSSKKRHWGKGDDANKLKNDVYGVAGELALSRVINQPINQLTTLKNRDIPDVGQYEVKTTTWNKNGQIFVNESQLKRNYEYVAVLTKFFPKYVAVIGYIHGANITNGPKALDWRPDEKAYWFNWDQTTPFSMESFDV